MLHYQGFKYSVVINYTDFLIHLITFQHFISKRKWKALAAACVDENITTEQQCSNPQNKQVTLILSSMRGKVHLKRCYPLLAESQSKRRDVFILSTSSDSSYLTKPSPGLNDCYHNDFIVSFSCCDALFFQLAPLFHSPRLIPCRLCQAACLLIWMYSM